MKRATSLAVVLAIACMPLVAAAGGTVDGSCSGAPVADRAVSAGGDADPDEDGPESRDWEASIDGSGRWTRGNGDVEDSHYALSASLQYYLTENIEPGLRQTVEWVNPRDESSLLTGSTRIAIDVNFPMGKVRPFVGGSFGLAYGDGIDGTDNLLAPEAGIKFYIGERTFLILSIELDAVFNSWHDLDQAWDDADVLSSIGVGYYW
jgi:hypothetical protein